MLFILIFSISIVLITIIEIPIIIFLLRAIALIIFFFSKNRNIFFTISWALLLALISWQFYQRRYFSPTSESRHLSTGTISETLWSWKYLYTNNQADYLLYTTKSYIPGNKIRLVARNSFQSTISPSLTSINRDSIFYSGFNVQKRSKMKWYANILYETNSLLIETWTLKWFPKIRYLLSQRIEKTYQNNKTAWLVLGMLIWDKSKFSKSEYQLFVDSGLVHLVAVSGGNIVMLVAFLTAILFFVPFYARITLILLAVLGYWIICWMDSSVLRAVLMGSLSLLALLVGRWTSLRRLLGLVHIGMLIYNPYFLVYDVGYLLSFSAVLWIVFIDIFQQNPQKNPISHCERKRGKPKLFKLFFWIRSNYLKPSLWATLGIFPVIIFFMGKINIGGIVWNMFVLPLVPFIMIGGLIGWFIPSRLQKYYVPCIEFLVARNYRVATRIDYYWPTIIADATWIKFLLFALSVIMMIMVIRTLTNHEVATTDTDNTSKELDTPTTSPYDDIINQFSVEISKKP